MIEFKKDHIWINHQLIQKFMNEIEYAYISFIEKQNQLLITPITSKWFIKMYKNHSQLLLKSRNLEGDKTINIREVIIDNNLELETGPLSYELIEKTKLIKIKL